ncbi:cyclic nucleotide-binding domain-containing protein [Algoriphagus antarcticus]|uniref:CRP-like cAMP-binding protein n=1 Tax=Algoriphagus antarcticus TaxID=238540 RepID=A0A3E0D4R7_9BACT|nr:hypothetical protein [Algoriphagus antarcticus]REG77517.1 CRP-like cAMP-binding protein [Algoriphagus antarcticus]
MEPKFLSQLIRDYDQLLKLPCEAYEWVLPHLKQINLKRGTVIKKSGSVDMASRYLCEGFIGSYKPIGERLMLSAIYKLSDTVFDESSFRTGIASNTVLKTISKVIFMEFPQEVEINLLDTHASLASLAHKVAHRIMERNARVYQISKLGLSHGYEVLMKEFPGLEAEITNSDLASFFGVHNRTVERWKHNLKRHDHE